MHLCETKPDDLYQWLQAAQYNHIYNNRTNKADYQHTTINIQTKINVYDDFDLAKAIAARDNTPTATTLPTAATPPTTPRPIRPSAEIQTHYTQQQSRTAG